MAVDVEEAIKTRLDTFSGLTALVSSRIYYVEMPQDVAYPAVVYQRITTDRPSAMGSDIGIARVRFQVTVYGDVAIDVRNAAQQVRAALQRWNGTEQGVVILATFMEDEIDQKNPDVDIFQRIIDVEVNHRE